MQYTQTRRFRRASVLLSLFSVACHTTAAPLTPAQIAQIDVMVADYVPSVLPGLQLAVGRGGEVQYKHGYGVANVRVGAPMTPATPVRTGSRPATPPQSVHDKTNSNRSFASAASS